MPQQPPSPNPRACLRRHLSHPKPQPPPSGAGSFQEGWNLKPLLARGQLGSQWWLDGLLRGQPCILEHGDMNSPPPTEPKISAPSLCTRHRLLTKSALIDGHGNNHNSPTMHANSGGVNATVSTDSIAHSWVVSTRCYISQGLHSC